jgi:hypothetical protein
MVYRALGDAVVALHAAFIVFVAVGGLLAWRWRLLVWLHIPAVLWGAAIVVIGFECPLTPLEKWLRERGGDTAYEGGFVDRYVEGVVYPEAYTPHLRALAAVLVAVAYARLLEGRRPGAPTTRAGTAALGGESSGNAPPAARRRRPRRHRGPRPAGAP